MTKVISLGGSLIVPESIDVNFLKRFKALIEKISRKEKLIIVCGGGKTCRKYIAAAKKISSPSTDDLDWIGIPATRLNAELVRVMLGKDAHPKVIYNPSKKVRFKKIIIHAGDKPGSSSDHDAVLLAKTYKSKEIINLTNIDYIFNKDPKKHKSAKPIKGLSWNQYLKIIGTEWISGKNYPFDPVASKAAKKYGLRLKLLNGKNIKNVENCLKGKEFKGTIVVD
ncbi:UMP kinase [Candidatus Woesearchaeota archaeon]|nr:UMP kinase [Candidatus Woesearchaeota archaeon]